MVKIDIFCPLYNAEKYLKNLNRAVICQECQYSFNVCYILTESTDSTEEILISEKCKYYVISKNSFSHSLVRENAARSSKADIIVFISQDIQIANNHWLNNLVSPIVNKLVAATYSRQISKYNNIEKYIREYNYPQETSIKSISDINDLGLYTFFFSDVSSAIDRKVFEELNYYDHKKLTISEDMYIAYKLIMNNHKIQYCADSVVYHSHYYSLKQLYERYKFTGIFFSENSYLNKYSKNNAGKDLALYVLKRAFRDLNLKVLFRIIPDMLARLFGMYVGKSLALYLKK